MRKKQYTLAILAIIIVLLLFENRWQPDISSTSTQSLHMAQSGEMDLEPVKFGPLPVDGQSTPNVTGHVSTSERAHDAPGVAAINARSAQELQVLVDTLPYDPDVLSSVSTILDVCDDPRLEKDVSVVRLIQYMEREGRNADASYLRQIRRQFCDQSLRLPYPSDEDFADTLLNNRLRTSPALGEIERIVDAAPPWPGAMDADDHATLIATATELLASTPSFQIFHDTGNLLIEQHQFNAFLIKSGWGHIAPVADAAAKPAIQLAGCEIFGGCAANQIRAISQCIHGGCDPAMPVTLEEHVVDRTSPFHLRQAEDVVEMILWLRSGRT